MLKKKKYMAAAAAAAVLIAVIVIVWVVIGKKDNEAEEYRCNLGNGIYILSAGTYTGEFVEDGSDRAVENVWKLQVINTSDKDVQFLKIKAQAEDEEGVFEITTLTAGGTVEVLEASGAIYPEEEADAEYQAENLVFFQEELSLQKEHLQISAQDYWIRVENTGSQAIEGDIYVYYKNAKEDVFQGGITYRARLQGGLNPGEARELEVSHYRADTSKIMYVDYQ
ncbi:MAG: hypothetical protein U0N90_08500 [Blautia sp.]|jgi:hypothetical protein